MAIHFHTIDVDYSIRQKNAIKRWIMDCVSSEGRRINSLHVILCSDQHLLELNQQFLEHDYYTDVITFNYNTAQSISGDIYISITRVFDNALQFQSPREIELYRVVIHGVMHLCGYNDKTKKEQEIMRKKEDACLIKLSNYI